MGEIRNLRLRLIQITISPCALFCVGEWTETFLQHCANTESCVFENEGIWLANKLLYAMIIFWIKFQLEGISCITCALQVVGFANSCSCKPLELIGHIKTDTIKYCHLHLPCTCIYKRKQVKTTWLMSVCIWRALEKQVVFHGWLWQETSNSSQQLNIHNKNPCGLLWSKSRSADQTYLPVLSFV